MNATGARSDFETELSRMLAVLGVIVARLDVESQRIHHIGSSARMLVGVDPAEMLASDMLRFVHPEDRPGAVQHVREILVARNLTDVPDRVVRMLMANGKETTMLIRGRRMDGMALFLCVNQPGLPVFLVKRTAE